MIKYYKDTPDVSIEVFRPSYGEYLYQLKPIIAFSSKPNSVFQTDEVRMDLIQYNFSESLEGRSNFSFTCTIQPLKKDLRKTVFDLIQIHDFVKIYEYGVVRFCGFITDSKFSMAMSGEGVQRRITFSGIGFDSLLQTLVISTSARDFPQIIGLEVEERNLKSALSEKVKSGQPIYPLIDKIVSSYKDLNLKVYQKLSNTGGSLALWELFDTFVKFNVDSTLQFVYDTAIQPIDLGHSSLWGIIRGIAPPPLYEVFGSWRMGRDPLFLITIREVPFSPERWKELPLFLIDEVFISSLDLGRSSKNAFSYFIGSISGSYISEMEARQIGAGRDLNFFSKVAWAKYGYKPLTMQFKYFDPGSNGKIQDQWDLLKKLIGEVKPWYENGDQFISGTLIMKNTPEVTEITYPKKIVTNMYPRIGCRLKLLGGEFYIEKTTNSWTYPNSMTRSLELSRGLKFTGSSFEPIDETNIRVDEVST